MSLATLLTDTAAKFADRPALKLDDAVLNYAVLDEAATRVAGLLKDKGVAPGDRVGIMLPNVPYFGAVYYGILRAGGGGRADERAAQGPRGRVLPVRLGREGRCSRGTGSRRRRRRARRRPARS